MNTFEKSSDPRWLMRWFILIVYLLALLVSLGIGIALVFQAKNLVWLGSPGLFLGAMRPIVRFLFGNLPRKGK